jgi:hypothetical protein
LSSFAEGGGSVVAFAIASELQLLGYALLHAPRNAESTGYAMTKRKLILRSAAAVAIILGSFFVVTNVFKARIWHLRHGDTYTESRYSLILQPAWDVRGVRDLTQISREPSGGSLTIVSFSKCLGPQDLDRHLALERRRAEIEPTREFETKAANGMANCFSHATDASFYSLTTCILRNDVTHIAIAGTKQETDEAIAMLPSLHRIEACVPDSPDK